MTTTPLEPVPSPEASPSAVAVDERYADAPHDSRVLFVVLHYTEVDLATALRLLAAHRESAARQRAIRSNEDSEAIIQSINAKLERIRQRRALAGDTTPSAPDDDVAA